MEEDCKFKVMLGYITSHYFKEKRRGKKREGEEGEDGEERG
jgi:hypothetical protein